MSYYQPHSPESQTAIAEARQILESRMAEYGIHTVYEGRNLVDGKDCGPAVVAVVETKGPRAQAEKIPPYIITSSGQRIPTDVVVAEKPKDLRLRLPKFGAQAQNDLQRCHDCMIPGGVQIAPAGANWVGTLSCALKLKTGKYAALTNAHVSGLDGLGKRCCQPHGSAGYIGVFSKVVGIRFDGQANYIDAALIDTWLTEGAFSPGQYTVKPEQFGLGRISPTPYTPKVGDTVKKAGRTTGITTGRVVGINGTSHVGYDEGTAKFERQIIIEANSGNFSAGGDSGSLILSADMRPVALLFAGGGGQTIANPIPFVLDWAQAEFF